MGLLFVVDTTRLLVAVPLFLNKQSVASLERGGFSRNVTAWSLQPGSAEDSARQAASVAAGRVDVKELAVYHAVP